MIILQGIIGRNIYTKKNLESKVKPTLHISGKKNIISIFYSYSRNPKIMIDSNSWTSLNSILTLMISCCRVKTLYQSCEN